MKIHTTLCSSLLVLATVPSQVLAKATDYAEFKVVSPAPQVTVTATANSFTSATANGPLKFFGEARGRCNWGYRYTFVSTTLDKDQSNGGSPAVAGNDIFTDNSNKNRTWSSGWKSVDVSMNMDNRIRSQAVEACNTELDKRVAQGNDRLNVIHAGFSTSIEPYYMGFHFHCSDYGLGYFQNHKYKPAPVTVNCEAGPNATPKPKPATPLPANVNQFSPALQLTMIDVKASPENYKGICPADITFTGYIHSNGVAGQAQYRFIIDGKAVSGFKPIALAQGNKVTQVSHVMQAKPPRAKLKGNNNGGQKGFAANEPQPLQGLTINSAPKVELEVKTSKQSLKDQANYNYSCETPKQATLVPAQASKTVDLTSLQGMQIGQQSAPWGGVINLTRNDASELGPRGCVFRFAYDVVNTGNDDASGFHSNLKNGNATLHNQTNMSIAAKADTKVSGTIHLLPGNHLLNAELDYNKAVTESNEQNNRFRLQVNVAEDCGNEPPRPARLQAVPRRPNNSALPQ